MEIESLVETYFRECVGANENTLKAKRKDLEYFVEYLHGKELTRQTLEKFLNKRLEIEAPASANRRLANVKHFIRYALETEGKPDFTRHVKPATLQKNEPQWLSEPERVRLDRQIQKLSVRDALLIELQRKCGLRRAEVVALGPQQVDLKGGKLRNVKRKGGKYQNIYLPSSVQSLIRKQLLMIPPSSAFLIPGRFGEELSTEAIYLLCERVGFRAGIEGMNPHRLRHTFIREIYEKTKDIRLAAEAAGHSDIRITMTYTAIGEEELRVAIMGL